MANDHYGYLTCPECSSPNIEIDIENKWFCYDCDATDFEPFEEGE